MKNVSVKSEQELETSCCLQVFLPLRLAGFVTPVVKFWHQV